MSQLSIRNSLLTKLETLAITDIAYENAGFDPTGKDDFMAAYFIPATSDSCGKTSASSDDERGIFRVSVFIKSNAKTFDNRQLEIIDTLKQTYYNGVVIDDVQIGEVTIAQPVIDGAHYRRDVNIDYTSFQSRI